MKPKSSAKKKTAKPAAFGTAEPSSPVPGPGPSPELYTNFCDRAKARAWDARHFPHEDDAEMKHRAWKNWAYQTAFEIKRGAKLLDEQTLWTIDDALEDVIDDVDLVFAAAKDLCYDQRRKLPPAWVALDTCREQIASARLVFQFMAEEVKARKRIDPALLPLEARRVWDALYHQALTAPLIALALGMLRSDDTMIRKTIERIRKRYGLEIIPYPRLGYVRPDALPPGVTLPAR